jgi:hypothetical protein
LNKRFALDGHASQPLARLIKGRERRTMVDWKRLLEEDARERRNGEEDDDWRQEAADSLCELYYETYRVQKGRGKRLDLRPGSDYRRFLDSHMKPLGRYGVWEALFPNRISATSAQAIDEALHLLADTKLVDRVYSGDIVTVTKIVTNIQKKRGKYLELDGRAVEGEDDELVVDDAEAEPDDLELALEIEEE